MNIIESFEKDLLAKGYSKVYLNPISIFLRFSEKKKYDYKYLSLDQLNDFIVFLKNGGKSEGYINNFIKAVKFFYKNCLSPRGLCTHNALKLINDLKQIKEPKKKHSYLTESEVKNIIEKGESFIDRLPPYKLPALIWFLYYTGLRLDEVTNLKRKDINLQDCSILIKLPVKNKTENYRFFPKRVGKMLDNYFTFEEETNNAFNITGRSFAYLLDQLQDFAPQGVRLHPHIFKHSCAQMLLKKGFNLREIQKLLGHKSLDSTLIYCDPDERAIKEKYKEKVK